MVLLFINRSRIFRQSLFFKKKRRSTSMKRLSDEGKFAEVLMATHFMSESVARCFHQDLKELSRRFGGEHIQISIKVY